MSWFAAHLIMCVKLKDRPQDRFPLWENVVLIRADSEEEAFARAEKRGREDAGDDDGSFRWGGQPAELVFAGVRKLTVCPQRPADGTEVTFVEMVARSEADIAKLLAGEPVSLQIADRFAEATALQ